jgi:Kef-type K+ transport system membrane component KefB
MEEIRLLLDIAILLFLAKIGGELAERARISHIVGEICAGLVAGPLLHLVAPTEMLNVFSMIGVIILLFLIGLSTRFDELKGEVYPACALAGIACAVSFIGGVAIGMVLGSLIIGFVIGVALMGTSTAVPIKILIDMGEFKSRVGRFLLTTAMADDVITLIGLAVLSTFLVVGAVNLWSVVTLCLAVIGFILVALTIGAKVSNAVLSVVQRLRDEQILLAIPLIITFVFAFVSERIGVAAVTGAFLAGMAMSGSVFTEPVIAPKARAIGYGFFIPLFFAFSGLLVGYTGTSWDLSSIAGYWWLIALLLIVGVLTKAISSGWVSGLFGFRNRERGIIAIGMIPRGEYGIVIAQLALGLGVISNAIYGSIVAFIVLSVIITPILYKLYLTREKYGKMK